MKNAEYWKKRFELLEQKQNQIGVQCFSDIEKQFRQAQKQLEGQLSAWYQRFADNNGISMQEARKWLTATELEEFKWDVNQYIQYGKENAINGQWVKQLENASARYHISRLEALKLQTQQSVETLFGNQLDSIDKTMKNVYRSGYYHTAFEIQKGFGVGWDFAALDDKQIAKVINTPWAVDGKNFSERVWNNRTKLISELNTELTRNIITGADPQKAIDAIARKMNASKKAAGKLVMTEEAFFSSAAQKDCFAELDVEQFEVVATLDSHTSEICQGMDGKHFKMSEWEVGVTAPPFHPWCRSTTVPYFDDDLGSIGERAAKGEDGKTYYVPANMTYKEWEKSFIGGGDKSELKEIKPDDIINGKPKTLSEKIKEIKDDIVANDGVITESHIKAAGKAVQDELIASRDVFKKELDDATSEYEGSDIKKKIDILNEKMSKLQKQYSDEPYGSERKNRLLKELDAAKVNYWNVRTSNEVKLLESRIKDARKKYEGTWKNNADELSAKLSEFRTVGIGSHDLKKEHYSGRGTMRDIVTEAYSHYPSDWVEASINRGTLSISKVSRGFYDGYELAIDSDSAKGQIECAFHELGHRFEDVVKGIYEAEDIFYKRRTAGCPLEWLGTGYSKSEKTRKDEFLNTYMGKEYPDNFYELVSMGFEYAYTNPTILWQDEDFAQFIYGILSLY